MKDPPALVGSVIIVAFLAFAFIEGMLQELAVLTKQSPLLPNYGVC